MTFSLAHAVKAQPFNGLFYATCATIIPVLFLAIAVQGSTYDDFLKSMARAFKRSDDLRAGPWLPFLTRWIIALIMVAAAITVLISACVGEVRALLALYHQSANHGTTREVLTETLIVSAAAIAGPALRFFMSADEAVATEDHPPAPTDALAGARNNEVGDTAT
jgi:hypothetical protein